VAATQPRPNAIAVVGLGANLGDASATVLAAARAMREWANSSDFRLSPLYRTQPIDAGGDDYVNAVAAFRTRLSPLNLLENLQALELQHHRERPYRNAPRTLDLDLLLYGEPDAWLTMHSATLTLPHPRMHLRAFALRPALDLFPQLHLGAHGNANACLHALGDQGIFLLG
jgi:2-amino-4-hydroxy-6-hydroxymethyldihydropteridine diphosphokinase